MMSHTPTFESAVQGIEQEKKMVAALKRLSIGNMMSYDPDLPMEDIEYQYKTETNNSRSNSRNGGNAPSRSKSSSSSPPHNSGPSSPTSPTSSPGTPHRKKSTLSRGSSLKRKTYVKDKDLNDNSSILSLESEEFYDAEDNVQIFDNSNTLLWVPANLHPEVDPDKFKSHVKTTVDEIMQRKRSRKGSVSRKSSLSSSTLPDEPAEQESQKRESFHQTNRFSNPSLRELTNELEKLSRLAGMGATDAVSLARTLSTTAIGYTDVEKNAMDEISSPPHSLPSKSIPDDEADEESLIDPDSPTSHKNQIVPFAVHQKSPPSSTLYLQQQLQQQFHNSQLEREQETSPENPLPPIPNSSSDFALKRSRRLDYRKQTGSTPLSLGSDLQNHKHGKLAELRNNLHANFNETTQNKVPRAKRQPSDKRNARDSQLLFSYRNPNEPKPRRNHLSPEPGSSKRVSSRDSNSPYPTNPHPSNYPTGSHAPNYPSNPNPPSSYPMVPTSSPYPTSGSHDQFTPKYNQQNMTAKRLSNIKSIRNGIDPSLVDGDVVKPRQAPPVQPYPASQYTQQYPQQYSQQYPQQYPAQPKHRSKHRNHRHERSSPELGAPSHHRHHHRSHQPEQKTLSQPYVSKPTSKDKTQQLNQNLDMLRSEISEFKESLTKNDPLANPKGVKNSVAYNTDNLQVSKVNSPHSSDANDSDFSFELSYQDVSYEDSLGIEKEVLKELGKEPLEDLFSDEQESPESLISPESQVFPHEQILPQGLLSDNIDGYSSENHMKDPPAHYREQEQRIKDVSTHNEPQIESPFTKIEPSLPSLKLQEEQKEQRLEKQLHQIEVEELAKELEDNPFREDSKVSMDSQGSRKSDAIVPPISETEVSDDSSFETSPKKSRTKKSFGALGTAESKSPTRKLKKKKSWPWLKERSLSLSSVESNLPTVSENNGSANRSFSSPEVTVKEEDEEEQKHKKSQEGKENMISKLFKKKKAAQPGSPSIHSIESKDSGVTVDYESDSENRKKKISGNIFKKKKSKPAEIKEKVKDLLQAEAPVEIEEIRTSLEDDAASTKEVEEVIVPEEVTITEPEEPVAVEKVRRKLKKSKKKEQTLMELQQEQKDEDVLGEDEGVQPQSTLDVQEKLKKSIRRTSRANQPIEFTDSAFGFPLPPPSQSTLVMLDYRFPVHVERAIYRLSHLKLANPKRSLREQVLLSNFMYAYLNLVDHTLHLEQQMTSDTLGKDPLGADDDMAFGDDGLAQISEHDNVDIDDTDFTQDEEAIPIDLEIEKGVTV